ncbi:Retrotransposon gag domain [Sesbania bispinosa]|nr:Retrotransposon gag domain [Sesbania bispinosa]
MRRGERDNLIGSNGLRCGSYRTSEMDQIFNKVGSYWFNQKASKELNSVGDDINALSNSIEGGTKWLVNKIKGKMQKALPELLKEYDLPIGIFPRDATNYEFNEETGKLVVYIPQICEVGYKDSSVLRFFTTVTGYLEKGKLAEIEGMKTKVLIWVKVTTITSEGSKLHVTAGMKKTRSREAYEEIITNILFANTAKEIWDDLKTRFSRKNGPHIYQLRKQLVSLQQGADDVRTYYTKLKSIWEELSGYKPSFSCTCGGLQHLQTYNESEYVMSFLMGLQDSFSQIRGQILLSDPLPSIGNVFSLILQEEAQREIGNVVPSTTSINYDNMAFTVNSSPQSSANSKNKFQRRDRPKCVYCGILCHTKDKCYKLVGYPPTYNTKNKQLHAVNQVLDSPESLAHSRTDTLSPAQCQQLINLLTNQMKLDNSEVTPPNVTGSQDNEED